MTPAYISTPSVVNLNGSLFRFTTDCRYSDITARVPLLSYVFKEAFRGGHDLVATDHIHSLIDTIDSVINQNSPSSENWSSGCRVAQSRRGWIYIKQSWTRLRTFRLCIHHNKFVLRELLSPSILESPSRVPITFVWGETDLLSVSRVSSTSRGGRKQRCHHHSPPEV